MLHGPVLQLPEPDFQCRLLGLVGKKTLGLGREESRWLHGGKGRSVHVNHARWIKGAAPHRVARSQTLPFSIECSETSRWTEHKVRAEHQVQLRWMSVQHPATHNSCSHPPTTSEIQNHYLWLLSSELEEYTNVPLPCTSAHNLILLGLTSLPRQKALLWLVPF